MSETRKAYLGESSRRRRTRALIGSELRRLIDSLSAVTGANRPNGIGFSLVSKLVKRTDALVFATARDPTRAAELQSLARENDNLVILKLEATSEADAQAAAEAVEAKAGRLDVLIANAGPSKPLLRWPNWEREDAHRAVPIRLLHPRLGARPQPRCFPQKLGDKYARHDHPLQGVRGTAVQGRGTGLCAYLDGRRLDGTGLPCAAGSLVSRLASVLCGQGNLG